MKTREIKFRAWDGKKMYIPASLLNNPIQCGYIDGSGCPKYCKDILMEYTGLKDKNGKEMCESDILEDINGERYEVIYDNDGFCASNTENGQNYMIFITGGWWYRIIGNVYENPELLKA